MSVCDHNDLKSEVGGGVCGTDRIRRGILPRWCIPPIFLVPTEKFLHTFRNILKIELEGPVYLSMFIRIFNSKKSKNYYNRQEVPFFLGHGLRQIDWELNHKKIYQNKLQYLSWMSINEISVHIEYKHRFFTFENCLDT